MANQLQLLLLQQVTLELQHQLTLEQAPQVQESVLEEPVHNLTHLREVDLEAQEWEDLVEAWAVCHQAWEWEECHQEECLPHSRCNK